MLQDTLQKEKRKQKSKKKKIKEMFLQEYY